jgi:hypothetical protein
MSDKEITNSMLTIAESEITDIRGKLQAIQNVKGSRELSLTLTKLDEAKMWLEKVKL